MSYSEFLQSYKYKHINHENAVELIPEWLCDRENFLKHLDIILDNHLSDKEIDIFSVLDFWIEVTHGNMSIRTPDNGADHCGELVFDKFTSPLGNICQVSIPLNCIFKDYPPIKGLHSVYTHAIDTETPLSYFGITKQKWYARLGQHVSSVNTGSPYIFHRSLREHKEKLILHKVLLCGLSFKNAMLHEEYFINEMSLYPMGMNMIPGGYAGYQYLGKMGIKVTSIKQRDASIEMLSKMPHIAGKPNPLCAARWTSDQDFVNRIICGHSGRLTVDQVNNIRNLFSFEKKPEEIMYIVGAKNTKQVKNVIDGKYYSRVGKSA